MAATGLLNPKPETDLVRRFFAGPFLHESKPIVKFDEAQPRDERGRWSVVRDSIHADGPYRWTASTHRNYDDARRAWNAAVEHGAENMSEHTELRGSVNVVPITPDSVAVVARAPDGNFERQHIYSIVRAKVEKYDASEPRDTQGQWTAGAGADPKVSTVELRVARQTALAKWAQDPAPTAAQAARAEYLYTHEPAARVEANMRGAAEDRRRREANLLREFGDGKTCPCVYCGLKIDGEHLTQDRMWPGRAGGRYTAANLVPACFNCNASRGDQPFNNFTQHWGIAAAASPADSSREPRERGLEVLGDGSGAERPARWVEGELRSWAVPGLNYTQTVIAGVPVDPKTVTVVKYSPDQPRDEMGRWTNDSSDVNARIWHQGERGSSGRGISLRPSDLKALKADLKNNPWDPAPMTDAGRAALAGVEKGFLKYPIGGKNALEHGAFVSKDGQVLREYTGTRDGIQNLGQDPNGEFKDAIFTHSHPTIDRVAGGSLSPNDLMTAMVYRAGEIRAVDSKNTYSMTAPSGGWNASTWVDNKDWVGRVQWLADIRGDRNEYFNWLPTFAEKIGATYTVTPNAA